MTKWQCRFEDTQFYGDDWSDVEARTPREAAEKFAHYCDCHGDYDIVKRGEADCPVQVKDAQGHVTVWRITAESIAHYYAKQIAA